MMDNVDNLAGHVRIYEEGSDMSGTAWGQVGANIDGEAAARSVGLLHSAK